MYKSTRVKIIFLIITVSVGFLSLLYFSNSFKMGFYSTKIS
jgi:hypothetical protein